MNCQKDKTCVKQPGNQPLPPADTQWCTGCNKPANQTPIWVVALILEKNIPGGTSTTQTLSYCQCESQQDALDHAILFAYKEKPGFAVLSHLINKIDLTTLTLNVTAEPDETK